MQERRRFGRKPLAVTLEICTDDNTRTIGKGFITNLSAGGMALETHKSLRLGEKLLLRFTLPNDWKFDVLSEIVYAQDGIITRAYGAKFSDINPETSGRLNQFLIANVKE
jgi:c-di-GMP-binding flagellar brake protein YcgR